MNDNSNKDKLKFQEILDEITNLKNYNHELGNNTRGETLENYIDNLENNIKSLEKTAEKVYKENFEQIETLE